MKNLISWIRVASVALIFLCQNSYGQSALQRDAQRVSKLVEYQRIMSGQEPGGVSKEEFLKSYEDFLLVSERLDRALNFQVVNNHEKPHCVRFFENYSKTIKLTKDTYQRYFSKSESFELVTLSHARLEVLNRSALFYFMFLNQQAERGSNLFDFASTGSCEVIERDFLTEKAKRFTQLTVQLTIYLFGSPSMKGKAELLQDLAQIAERQAETSFRKAAFLGVPAAGASVIGLAYILHATVASPIIKAFNMGFVGKWLTLGIVNIPDFFLFEFYIDKFEEAAHKHDQEILSVENWEYLMLFTEEFSQKKWDQAQLHWDILNEYFDKEFADDSKTLDDIALEVQSLIQVHGSVEEALSYYRSRFEKSNINLR